MKTLRSKSINALLWDLGRNYSGQIMGFVIMVLLARLLNPEDFGIIAMSMVTVNILKQLLDFGLTSALIQSNHINSITYSSVFYTNLIFATILSGVMLISADYVAAFYEKPEISIIISYLTLGFIFNSLNIVQTAILKKELNFKSITIRDISAQTFAGIIAIITAYHGAEYYALVIQFVVTEFIRTILLWNLTDWKPKIEYSVNEIKKLFNFSFYVFSSQVLGRITTEIDVAIVGKLFSAQTLGFYSQATAINNLVIRNISNSITSVFFPVLSKLQHDETKFKKVYIDLVEVIVALSILFVGIAYLSAEYLIVTVLGQKWVETVWIFKILIVKGFTNPVNSLIGYAFFALGKSKEVFYIGMIGKTLHFIPFIVAYIWGFEMFLYVTVSVFMIEWMMNNYFATLIIDIPLSKQFTSVLPIFGMFIISVFTIEYFLIENTTLIHSLSRVFVYVSIYIGYLFLTKSRLIVLIKEIILTRKANI